MKISASVFYLIALLARPSPISSACLEMGESIAQGAWNYIGVNGTWDPRRDDENNVNTNDPTWTIPPVNSTWKYDDGSMGNYGPDFLTHYTCSILQFCNHENETAAEHSVYKMASQDHFDSCNFTDAELLGKTNETTCVEVPKDDLSEVGEENFYASMENCEAGQKVATMTSDWESTATQCAAIAEHVPASSRIRGCDCSFTKKAFSGRYAPLCAYGYQEACFAIEMPGDCCESDTCFSKLEVWETEEGKEYEMDRRESCDDDIPGMCYNEDGVASDLSQDGSTNCCTQTCSTCGSESASGASWEMCTSNDPENMTATCGRLSRYASEEFICDFKMCNNDDYWGRSGDPIYNYMGIESPAWILNFKPNLFVSISVSAFLFSI